MLSQFHCPKAKSSSSHNQQIYVTWKTQLFGNVCSQPNIWPYYPGISTQALPSRPFYRRIQWNLALRTTSLVRYPHHYGLTWSVPNCILQCKLAPCTKVTSPLSSLLPSPVGGRICEGPLYRYPQTFKSNLFIQHIGPILIMTLGHLQLGPPNSKRIDKEFKKCMNNTLYQQCRIKNYTNYKRKA